MQIQDMASQEIFNECYRGRQTALHHMAYMRMAKVLLTRHVLTRAGVRLENKSLFDYGFGAGTFFRYCPGSTRLSGVELDAASVAEVRQMLLQRGLTDLHLDAIDIKTWAQHPLLQQRYDVVLCSHVLEHLADPVGFISRIKECLVEQGAFVALVPINERAANAQHVQTVDERTIHQWAGASGMCVRAYVEADPWIYWIQPLFATNTGWRYRMAQAASLGIGVPATLLGYRAWHKIAPAFAAITRSKPTQAAFVLARNE